MAIPDVTYNPGHFTPTEVIRGAYGQKSVVGRQEVYISLGDGNSNGSDGDTYLRAVIEQPSDRRKSPYVIDAHLVRGMSAAGGWRQSHNVPAYRLKLIADSGAPAQPKPATPTRKVSKTAREYLAATYGAPSKAGQ